MSFDWADMLVWRDGRWTVAAQAFAWWVTADLIAAFETLDKNASVSLKHMAKLCGARTVTWPDARGFINLNTPEDVEAFEAAYPE